MTAITCLEEGPCWHAHLAAAVMDRFGHVHDLQDHTLLPASLHEAARKHLHSRCHLPDVQHVRMVLPRDRCEA